MTRPAPTYDRNKEIDQLKRAGRLAATAASHTYAQLEVERARNAQLEAENSRLRAALKENHD